MDAGYCKRFRMGIDLPRSYVPLKSLPVGYQLVPWNEALLDVHARTKYQAFCHEIDAQVFPCLGELSGCRRLMHEIRRKPGFLPEATWLIARKINRYERLRETHPVSPDQSVSLDRAVPLEWCGTIQGVLDSSGNGSIQNIGIVPSQRGGGLGSILIEQALSGFESAGAYHVTLEVTAENIAAIRLYQRLGFRRSKTIYKPVDSSLFRDEESSSIGSLPLGFPSSRLHQENIQLESSDHSQQNMITSMVSSVVHELAVAETPPDMAESDIDKGVPLVPVTASKPLGTSSPI